MQEEHTASGTTTEGEILEMLNIRKFILNVKAHERSKEWISSFRIFQYKLKKWDEKINRVLDKFPHFKKKAPMTVAEKKYHQEI